MKKVLFATTALIATAGVAAADVSISGFAEMGINGGTNTKDQFHTDIDVTFSMSGQTDNGIAFGTSVDLDEAGNITGVETSSDNDGVAIFMSGAFGRVTMGDTDGALDWALDGAGMGGAIGDNHTGHAGYYDGGLDGMYDNVVLSYAYTIGDFALLVSAELNDEAKDTGDAAVDADGSLGFGARYTAAMGGADFTFGVAMQSGQYNSARADAAATGFYATHFSGSAEGNTLDAVGASIKAAMANGLTAVATITDFDHTQNTLDAQHTSLGLAYTAGVMTIAANMGEFDSNTAAEDRDGWGLAFNYGLGGGATFQAGYGSGSVGTAPETENYSIGIAMSF